MDTNLELHDILAAFELLERGVVTMTPEQEAALVEECRNLGCDDLSIAKMYAPSGIYTELSMMQAEKRW